ncbi:MAG: ParB N-terminal domain-containing protein [Oscillospiraceae bacterium]
MGKAFNLADFMPSANVSKLDTPAREIKMLPTRSIFPNDKNFYDTSNVSDLIDSILLHGMLDPLTVRPAGDGEGYIIISGHRRHKAIMTILDDALAEDLTPFETTPCFVAEPRDELMEELMLIQANSATRVLTSAELAKQAEKIEELLYRLKEQGYEFPGRMRDHVAKACGVAASRLGRLKVIRENLIPELYERFEGGMIPENAAYEAARMPERDQQILAQRHKKQITMWEVGNVKRWLETIDVLKECHDGDKCDQYDLRIQTYTQNGSLVCAGRCCANCYILATCDKACAKCADRRKEQIAEREQREAKERAELEARNAEAKARSDAREREVSRLWQRLGDAREAAGIDAEEFYNGVLGWNADEDDIRIFCDQESGKIQEDAWIDEPLFDVMPDELRSAAVALHCTTDYLLGISDDPQPSGTGRWRCVADGELPVEGQAVITILRFSPSSAWSCNTSVYHNGKFRFTQDLDMELLCVQYWMPSPELPE